MARTRTNDQPHSLEQLRQRLPRGTRMFTILRAVSRSGMCREVSVMVCGSPGQIARSTRTITSARCWACVVARTMG